MRLKMVCLLVIISLARAQAPDLHLRGDRFAPLVYDKMTPEQKALTDHLLSGERHTADGPFNVLLRSPEMATSRRNSARKSAFIRRFQIS
jgi:hypothetical protein